MFNLFRRRRLSKDGRRRMMLAVARSEEALLDTHVANVFGMLEMLGHEIDVDHTLELYVQQMSLPEHLASTVATRVLAHLGGEVERPTTPPAPTSYRGAFRER
jgi:hypothetical protein